MMEILKDSLSDELDGYLVRSMDVYEYLRDFSSKPIQWDYGMSIMNNATVNYLKSLEADAGYCPSLELNRHDLNQLNTDLSEMVVYGYTNVMTSAACIRMNTTGCVKEPGKIIYIEDRKGVKVPVETVCQFCYNNIYNGGVPHYLIDKMKALMSQGGVGMFRLDFLNETTQTIDMLMKSAMMGEELTEHIKLILLREDIITKVLNNVRIIYHNGFGHQCPINFGIYSYIDNAVYGYTQRRFQACTRSL